MSKANFLSAALEGLAPANIVDSASKINTIETFIAGILVFISLYVLTSMALKRLKDRPSELGAKKRFDVDLFFELLSEFIFKVSDQMMGRENRKYMPFVASVFCFIFFCNILGLIPGFSMPTDSVTFNLGIALVVFFLYNYWGVKELGLAKYLKHFCGPVMVLAPVIFVMEIVSHLIRPFALSLRLFGNMTGDHAVIEAFTELAPHGVPVVFYFFGTFVCFVQAFVFALLSMVYIRFALEQDH